MRIRPYLFLGALSLGLTHYSCGLESDFFLPQFHERSIDGERMHELPATPPIEETPLEKKNEPKKKELREYHQRPSLWRKKLKAYYCSSDLLRENVF